MQATCVAIVPSLSMALSPRSEPMVSQVSHSKVKIGCDMICRPLKVWKAYLRSTA